MPVTFKTKTRRYRGKRTFGYGKIGTKRAKGQKGGHGLTSGKFKHKWSYYQKMKVLGFPGPDGDKWRIGKKGFKIPQGKARLTKVNAINIKDIEMALPKWLAAEKVTMSGKTYVIDLGQMNYQKLLGKGNVTKKMEITVAKASAGAIEKLKAAKCKLSLTAAQDA